MKLIQIQDYLLLIDEEAEIKMDDYCVNFDRRISHLPLKIEKRNIGGYGSEKYYFSHKKVIAYYPLNSEAKELDLQLLPPFEIDIEKLGLSKYKELTINLDLPISGQSYWVGGFQHGYKAAQSKQFSLEDMEKAFEYGKSLEPFDCFEDFIKSLSTQQLPSEFIPEYEDYEVLGERNDDGYPLWSKRLKTITNSENKEVSVGTYKY